MDYLDLVVKICKDEKGLTNNHFYKICEKYNLSVEQMKQALALVNGLTGVPASWSDVSWSVEREE